MFSFTNIIFFFEKTKFFVKKNKSKVDNSVFIIQKLLMSKEKDAEGVIEHRRGCHPPVTNHIKPKRRRCDKKKWIKLSL